MSHSRSVQQTSPLLDPCLFPPPYTTLEETSTAITGKKTAKLPGWHLRPHHACLILFL
jgi:hypothetical protein